MTKSQTRIIDQIRQYGPQTIQDLTRDLHYSVNTIRTGVTALVKNGQLEHFESLHRGTRGRPPHTYRIPGVVGAGLKKPRV